MKLGVSKDFWFVLWHQPKYDSWWKGCHSLWTTCHLNVIVIGPCRWKLLPEVFLASCFWMLRAPASRALPWSWGVVGQRSFQALACACVVAANFEECLPCLFLFPFAWAQALTQPLQCRLSGEIPSQVATMMAFGGHRFHLGSGHHAWSQFVSRLAWLASPLLGRRRPWNRDRETARPLQQYWPCVPLWPILHPWPKAGCLWESGTAPCFLPSYDSVTTTWHQFRDVWAWNWIWKDRQCKSKPWRLLGRTKRGKNYFPIFGGPRNTLVKKCITYLGYSGPSE